jgi:hypothetical protein
MDIMEKRRYRKRNRQRKDELSLTKFSLLGSFIDYDSKKEDQSFVGLSGSMVASSMSMTGMSSFIG